MLLVRVYMILTTKKYIPAVSSLLSSNLCQTLSNAFDISKKFAHIRDGL